MNDVFYLGQNTYNLRKFHAFATDVPRNNYLLKSVAYKTNQLWKILAYEFENLCSLELCKDGLKNW